MATINPGTQIFYLPAYNLTKEELISLIKVLGRDLNFKYCRYWIHGQSHIADKIEDIFSEDIPPIINNLDLFFTTNDSKHALHIYLKSKCNSHLDICSDSIDWKNEYKEKVIGSFNKYKIFYCCFFNFLHKIHKFLYIIYPFLFGFKLYPLILKSISEALVNSGIPIIIYLLLLLFRPEILNKIISSSNILTKPCQKFTFWQSKGWVFACIIYLLIILSLFCLLFLSFNI